MKVALIGATGFVGAKVLAELLSRGHTVTAVGRKLDGLHEHPALTARMMDILDSVALAKVLEGHDAVISAFNPGRMTAGEDVYRQHVAGHRAIIDAVKASGVTRFIAVGGAASLKTASGQEFLDSPEFPAEYEPYKGAIRGTREQFYMLKEEPSLDWVFLAPSVYLLPGERTAKYRVGGESILYGEDGQSRISLEDYAVALADELETPAHHRQRFTVGY